MENILQIATLEDAPALAGMNRMLIEDEGSPNPMSVTQLEVRMRRWLASGEYEAIIIWHNDDIVGYVLYREDLDEYDVSRRKVYVRQFFIKRAYRRRGIGKTAFEHVVQSTFPEDANIVLEVLSTNLQGRAFWERLGFEPYFTTYRRHVDV
ncbi:MAG: GNAT family N-acetyltransferase [Chloroflexota bacterium]